jgi:hypothetical protein
MRIGAAQSVESPVDQRGGQTQADCVVKKSIAAVR